MYKLLIADDEEWIRMGISQAIDWGKLGFSAVETASNGKIAIEKIQKNPPDMVISDVVMPQVTGLQLAEWIYNHHPEIKVILISGYDQFEYARKAIRFAVVDYILKPVEEEKLQEVVRRCLTQMNKQRSDISESARYQASLCSLKQLFYLKLVNPVNAEEIDYSAQSDLIRMPLNEKCAYIGALIKPDSTENREDFCHMLQKNLSENMPNCISWELIDNTYTCIVLLGCFDTSCGLEHTLTDAMHLFLSQIKFLNPAVCIVSNYAEGIRQFRRDMIKVENAFHNAYVFPEKDICQVEQLIAMQRGNREANRAETDAFVKLFSAGTNLPSEKECDDFLDALLLQNPQIGKKELGKLLYHTLMDVIKVLENFGHTSLQAVGESEMLGWVFTCSTLDELRQNLRDFIRALSDLLSAQDDDSHKKMIREALEYIRTHYNSEISLTDIADHLHISNSYFSQLFGKEIGIGFAKYLMNYRIEKAKELLDRTNLRIYQISEKVGYPDVKYFMKLFKKSVGVSPQIYREKKNL